MATIKMCTDIPQSKVLAKILPLESADMIILNSIGKSGNIDGTNCTTILKKNLNPLVEVSEILPCWSLAALLSVLPDSIYDNTNEFSQLEFTKKSVAYIHGTTDGIKLGALKDNLVDACVEMIIRLYELKML